MDTETRKAAPASLAIKLMLPWDPQGTAHFSGFTEIRPLLSQASFLTLPPYPAAWDV